MRGIRNTSLWWKEMLLNNEMKGKIFESIVVNEFVRKNDRVYYWYSSTLKKEVDVLIRDKNGKTLYEVKNRSQKVKPVFGQEVKVITPKNFDCV